jgi:hypothetical protein
LGDSAAGIGVAGATMLERSLREQLALGVVVCGRGDLLTPGGALFVTRAGDALVQLAQRDVARTSGDRVAEQVGGDGHVRFGDQQGLAHEVERDFDLVFGLGTARP